MSAEQQIEQEVYSLVITRSDASEVLCVQDGAYCALPLVEIPRWERVAPQINSVVHRRFRIEAYCLSAHFSVLASGTDEAGRFCAMEFLQAEAVLSPGLYWVSVSSLNETTFRTRTTLANVQRILSTIRSKRIGENGEGFGTTGALRNVTNWVQSQVESLGLRLTGQFRQLTASPTFSLLRFETNGPPLWFKAVGSPNIREFAITRTLSEFFPDFLPRVVAFRPQWHAWLMTEAGGIAPDASSKFAVWQAVIKRLAELQIASICHTKEILAAGARDATSGSLLERVDEFLAVMQELMTRQVAASPTALTCKEVSALSNPLKQALSKLAEGVLPEALNHLDFNPGNILVSGDQCVFLDWAEAAVGPPVLTFEYLMAYFRRSCTTASHRSAELAAQYEDHWRSYVANGSLSEYLAFSPLVAILAYALSNDAWQDSKCLANPQTAGYFRALTRRMKHEADILAQRTLQCPCQ